MVASFLQEFPAPLESQTRRVRAIRLVHEHRGCPLELPGAAPRPTAMREGPEWASLDQALAQLPTHQHRKYFSQALRGRRDAWLLILIGLLGLTRRAAQNVVESDVVLFPRLTIKGFPVEASADPATCHACAVTRWLRVVGAASFGWRNDVKEQLDPATADLTGHDCNVGLDGTWRQAQTLLPHIDRYGWVSVEPMTLRAISATIADRLSAAEATHAQPQPVFQATGRFADATSDELAAAYDDADAQAAAILLRLKQLVGEGDEALARLEAIKH